MIVLLLILLLLVLCLSYLLFAPVYLEIDSRTTLCRMRFHRLMSVNLVIDNSLNLELRIAWWKKTFDLLGAHKKTIRPAKKRRRKRRQFPFGRFLSLLQSFKVNKFMIDIDTGEDYLNGILFPLFYLTGLKTGHDIRINFYDDSNLVIEIENNIISMLLAFIKPKTLNSKF